MSAADPLLAEARRQFREGQVEAARETCRAALEREPENAAALELMGVLASRLGDVDTAVRMLEQAARQRPGEVRLLANLGAVYRAAGRIAEAEARYRDALALDPAALQARFNLANLLSAEGATEPALREYVAVIERDPDHAGALNNMAGLLKAIGRFEEAEQVYRALLAEYPGDASAHSNLAAVCMDLGRLAESVAHCRDAIALNPNAAEPYNNLGVALLSLRRPVEALDAFDRALAIDPQNAEVHFNRGQALAGSGDPEGADTALSRAIAIRPDPRYRIARAGLLPVVPRSRQDMQQWRRRFVSEIEALAGEGLVLQASPLDASTMSFYLAYQGENDRDVMVQLSQFYRQACPMLQWTAPHCAGRVHTEKPRRIRVGFMSSYLREHAVAWTVQELLRQLPKEKFEIFIYASGRTDQPVVPGIAAVADHCCLLPHAVEPARRRIAAAALDILIYADIGMESLSYCLAHARLAPVQCATWGHPVTTGIPTVDYYISSDLPEPDDAAAHYSEKLVRLSGVQTCYRRPEFPADTGVPEIADLPADATVYLCPQSLFKIHPDMDAPLAEILRRDPKGVLLAFEGSASAVAERLRLRWRATFEETFRRVRFLPRVPLDRFLAILAAADVLLDTWPFGGGNTSYQGFAAGVPIVTLPGKYLRGRGTLAHYRHMGFNDCVAETPDSYVDIAVRLGTDPAFHARIAGLIAERSSVLFDDTQVGADLARFLLEASA